MAEQQISILGLALMTFIVALVGVTLAPSVAQAVGAAQGDANIDGASDVLLGLVTLMYALLVTSSVIGLVYYTMIASGLV